MAEIICFDKGGRDARRALVAQGRAPREFFYGVMDLQERGYDIEQLSSAEPYAGALGALYRGVELAWSHLTRLGLRTHCLDEIQDKMRRARVAVSFTDGFSLTLGRYYRNIHSGAPFLVGCFHGLSDFENMPAAAMRPLVRRLIRRTLQRLDHVAFFGPADREFGISRYGLAREKTSIILFGVDTGFWTPGEVAAEDFIFSMGQDPNRDFATLVGAEVDVPVRLHTALPVVVPAGRCNVTLSSGSYHRSTLSDEDLRDLYRRAMAVVVPLKDVYQPTGYSVTLQAMACGKPIVLSRIRGLWAPDLLRDGENCLLVPPGDRAALAAAIDRLAADPELRARLGRAARDTAERHFSSAAAAASLEALIRRGLAARPRPAENGPNGAQP
jgi:glycosyltransferase involved in cell wall biosynthesis